MVLELNGKMSWLLLSSRFHLWMLKGTSLNLKLLPYNSWLSHFKLSKAKWDGASDVMVVCGEVTGQRCLPCGTG